MKFLFVHQNYPGQFVHIINHLRKQPNNELVFISEQNESFIAGVRNVVYRKPEANSGTDFDAVEFEHALRRAAIVREMAKQLLTLGFVPDIIMGHQGWGEMLDLQDVWPDVPTLGYHEFYYNTHGFDVGFDPEFPPPVSGLRGVRCKNAVNLLALTNPGHGQTPTRFQLDTYPDWARRKITVLPEGVNLEICRPNPAVRRTAMEIGGLTIAPKDRLVTYVARDLEPYRGFHTMMRAVPHLHRLGPDVKVVLVGGDEVSYGARLVGTTWRQRMLDEVGGMIDPARVCFPGKTPYDAFVRLLQRSDAHVYLTYPFVVSWSLREALACGCALVASNTAPVQEFVEDRKTGLLVDFPNVSALVEGIRLLLTDTKLANRLRRNARAHAEATLDMDRYIAAYEELIGQVMRNELPC